MLTQLFYVSKRSLNCNDVEIEKILQSSVRNNAKANVTGVLLYSEKKFLQCIEGEFETIIALYDKIKQDPRHYDTVMLGIMPIKERSFPAWQMAGKSIDLNKIDFKTRMSNSERAEFEEILEGKTRSSERIAQIIKLFFK